MKPPHISARAAPPPTTPGPGPRPGDKPPPPPPQPDDVPPEIDDPNPPESPGVPVREPPQMPTPMASVGRTGASLAEGGSRVRSNTLELPHGGASGEPCVKAAG